MRAGDGAEEREGVIVAVVAGEFRRSGDVLSVLPVRRIQGDVDYGTGHITFPGSVYISGSVLDGFTVRSSGDIDVRGSVLAAELEAEGSVRVRGGVVGRGKGRVSAKGDVEARFIESARIEALGDIRVQKGILHSQIHALGTVTVEDLPGSVVGGFLRAGAGLCCCVLGSINETPTHICFGENFLAYRRLERIEQGLEILRGKLAEVTGALVPLTGRVDNGGGSADPEEVKLLQSLQAIRQRVLLEMRALMTARVSALAGSGEAPDGAVRVRDTVHVGVHLSSRGVERRIEESTVFARYRLMADRIEVGAYD